MNLNPQALSNEELVSLRKDQLIRQRLAHSSHLWFFLLYMSEYMQYEFAPFHYEMFGFTENEIITLINITAFRGSAKSTILSQSLPIWAVTGKLNKKFILLVSQTQTQAKLHLANIKQELMTNELLKKDIGPFQEITDEWSSSSIVIPKYDARISAVSIEQSMRGVRHHQHRPDLIILDDIEDLASVKTKEQRDKTYDWVMGDVIPAGNERTKIVIVGNLLHDDSVQMRLAEHIKNNEIDGVFREYPLLDKDMEPTWQSRFPDLEAINQLRRRVPSEVAWQREYLLRLVAEVEQVIHREWIHYYEELPPITQGNFMYAATGVDLAISQKEASDRTAMVSARIFDNGSDMKIFILPNPINKQMTFPATTQKIKEIDKMLAPGHHNYIFIEQVAYQEAIIQQLDFEGVDVEGVKIATDKRSRLAVTSSFLQTGHILFPKNGCEDLITQLVGFGKERYDDLADAFSLLVSQAVLKNYHPPRIMILDVPMPSGRRGLSDW